VDSRCFYSKGRNTPFEGFNLHGCARYTILSGNVVYERKGQS
jgi:dihydroorotase-like cyclic amidohydrolase